MSYDNCTEVTAQCPIAATTYGYAPNLVGNSIFVALFGLLLGSGLVLGIRARTWTYTFALSAGTFLETIGYIGHILMHNTMGSRQFLTADCMPNSSAFFHRCFHLPHAQTPRSLFRTEILLDPTQVVPADLCGLRYCINRHTSCRRWYCWSCWQV